jgi:hypothetical protein
MPRVGFEPMIPAFERANTVHGLNRAANVINATETTVVNWIFKAGIQNAFTLDLCRCCSSLDSGAFILVGSKILTKSGEYRYYVRHDGMVEELLLRHFRASIQCGTKLVPNLK